MQDAYTAQQKLAEVDNLFKSMDTWAFSILKISFNSLEPKHHFTVPLEKLHGKRWNVAFYQPSTIDFAADEWIPFNQYIDVCRNTFNPSKQATQEFYYVAIQGMKNDPYSADENACILLGNEIQGIAQSFRGGDILLARLGPCLSNKKSVIVPDSLDFGCGSPEFLVIRPKNGIDSRFVLWLIKSDLLVKEMLPKTKGATPSQMRLHAEDLLQLQVPKATSIEQQIVGKEVARRRSEAKRLRNEAQTLVTEAKARVEQMILGEEDGA